MSASPPGIPVAAAAMLPLTPAEIGGLATGIASGIVMAGIGVL